jgi:membrane associated rhomboid family serine protease
MMHIPMVTLMVIIFTTISSYFGFQNDALIWKFIFDVKRILKEREYYRLLSSALFHASWTHLLFNMFSFYAFAGYMERAIGPFMLLLLYIVSILGGGVLSLIINHKRDYLALGASGGVSGVIFASIFIIPGGSVMVFPLPLPIPPWLYAVLFVLISMYGMQKRMDNTGHDAHLGGALAGLLFTLWIYPAAIADELLFFSMIVLAIVIFIIYVISHPAKL